MKFDSTISGKEDIGSGSGNGSDALSSSQGNSKSIGNKPATIRNWAWAYGTDSYDWMESHGPFFRSDLSG